MGVHNRQQELHALLQAELLHTIGAYGLVAERLKALNRTHVRPEEPTPWSKLLGNVIGDGLAFNDRLRSLSNLPADLRTDPSLLLGHRPDRVAPRHPAPPHTRDDTADSRFVVDFYDTAAHALKRTLDCRDTDKRERCIAKGDRMLELGVHLSKAHDAERRSAADDDRHLIKGRMRRNEGRHDAAIAMFGKQPPQDRVETLLSDHLGRDEPDVPHLHVIAAFKNAHFAMHRAEHHLSHSFGDKLAHRATIDQHARAELERSIVLNTFVYVVARSTPWIFAENEAERDYVLANYPDCVDTLTPTYTMWIARQLSLLALHRRAYARWLLNHPDAAYRDFYKLVRFLRHLRPQVERRAVRAPGAMTFLDGLTAIAEHHIGRIYRSQHAHKIALKYFERSDRRTAPWREDPEIGPILRNSRWRIHSLVSQAKANYELGRIKECLLCYIRAWRCFVELSCTESRARANFELVDGLLDWLDEVIVDPEIDKRELKDRIAPLVEQFRTVWSPTHLRLMAADIIMRLGHVLLILKLPDSGEGPDHTLAQRCLAHAALLDQSSTLIAADLLKTAYLSPDDPKLAEASRKAVAALHPIETQWPAGGGRFEEAARVIEFVLQTWLDQSDPQVGSGHREQIARNLLASFLTHTDSSNVKLAQVYRYLMRDRLPRRDVEGPTMDVVSLRRFSSFFPFLPRPSTSPAPGGGYLVQVQDPEPLGIAIDPGPNFLDNLYRSGYGLGDIDMIIVTHDHADHLASLDALLSLIDYRGKVGRKVFDRAHRLIIVGNHSVCNRYGFFNDEDRPDAVKVVSFETLDRWTELRGEERIAELQACEVHLPATTLRIEPVRTYDHVDADNSVAQGVLISVGDGEGRSSVFLTSDTGPISRHGRPAKTRHSAGTVTMSQAAASAHVVIAHLSSVPLRELRTLAGLDRPPGKASRKLTKSFGALWEAERLQGDTPGAHPVGASGSAEFLLRQLQFAFRASPPKRDLRVHPLRPVKEIREQTEKHLFLSGVLEIAERMGERKDEGLLVIGELREELGSFRTRVAYELNHELFMKQGSPVRALTADIGLKMRVTSGKVKVLCSTCDLDNDLVDSERLHKPKHIREVCVKGEDEAIFYNCATHDPGERDHPLWVEAVERYDLFGE